MDKIGKIIILTCIFIGCTEREILRKQCFEMTVSNSLPVQFWINGQETFNEKDVCGITPVCFCQPFECDDNIKIRVTSTIEPSIKVFKSDEFFADVSFSEVETNEWETIINFRSDFSTCDGQFTLYITTSEGLTQFLLNSTFSSLTGWSATDWVLDAGKAVYEYDAAHYSGIISQSFSDKQAGIYSTTFKFTSNHFGAYFVYNGVGSLILKNNGAQVQVIDSENYVIIYDYEKTFSLSFTATEVFDEIEFEFIFNSGELAGLGNESERILANLNLWNDPASPNEWSVSTTPTIDFEPGQLSTYLTSPSLGVGLSAEHKRVVIDFDLVSVDAGGDTEVPITSFHDFTKWANAGTGFNWNTFGVATVSFNDTTQLNTLSKRFRNEIHETIGPPYPDIKKVTVDFHLSDFLATGGTAGDWEMRCELYFDDALVATSSNITTNGYGPFTNVFNFNDPDYYNNVSIRCKRLNGTCDFVKLLLDTVNLTYLASFDSLELGMQLTSNDSGTAIPGGTTTPFVVTAVGNYVHEFDFDTEGDLPQVQVFVNNTGIVGGQLRINSIHLYESFIKPKIQLDYLTLSEEAFAYKSDCISIKETHPCTLLIAYSNDSNFDGIAYADQSPNLSFGLRIPAVFYEEENTKEQEDIELSSDEIVRLYTKIEEKRLLRIGFMPHHMHRKVLLALSHDFVIIDDKDWIMRDEYKKNEGNRHYPLKTASVLLTDKNFIKENQL